MRILDATPPQDELGLVFDSLENDDGIKTIARSWVGAWRSSCEPRLCDKSRRENAMEDQLNLSKQPRPTAMSTTQNISRRAFFVTSRMMSLLVFLSVLSQPVAAVLLTNWQNCVDDGLKYSEPRELQWDPLYVAAQYEQGDVARTLRVTVWGNVSGSYGGVALPAWNSPEWEDANFTDGKIVQNPFPTTAARLTTLHDKIDVLTYEPYSADFDFCEDALTNRTCPLGPVFNTTAMYVYTYFPSALVAISHVTSWRIAVWGPLLVEVCIAKFLESWFSEQFVMRRPFILGFFKSGS